MICWLYGIFSRGHNSSLGICSKFSRSFVTFKLICGILLLILNIHIYYFIFSYPEKLKVVIPWIVLQELDGLKSTSNASKAARKAIGYLLVRNHSIIPHLHLTLFINDTYIYHTLYTQKQKCAPPNVSTI